MTHGDGLRGVFRHSEGSSDLFRVTEEYLYIPIPILYCILYLYCRLTDLCRRPSVSGWRAASGGGGSRCWCC